MELIKSRSRHFKLGDLIHLLFNLGLSVAVFLMVNKWDLYALALLLVLLSKWRIFAVQPRFWWANIQANTVDIIVGVSVIGLMYQADESTVYQAIWAVLYAFWLTILKPQSGNSAVALQAAVGQSLGITALFWFADSMHDFFMVAGIWIVAFSAARHLISSYEEDLTGLISAAWALFAAELAWLLNRWLIVYDVGHNFFVPQITIIILIVGYCAAHLYDYGKQDRLTSRQVQYVFGLGGLLLFLVLSLFSSWSGIT